jgi:hypothetical protein
MLDIFSTFETHSGTQGDDTTRRPNLDFLNRFWNAHISSENPKEMILMWLKKLD